ncbi:hypothetical protein [Corynebacterium sp. Marseille-P4321]|uniref:hypothetical protein n=1 Tax=Corynebacterium sp. Marseille-P4321 TaxID=2736603 RepID=UPI00158BC430|nr:hypothetical protein [Corynebacterium sp. Marseille-P4321]
MSQRFPYRTAIAGLTAIAAAAAPITATAAPAQPDHIVAADSRPIPGWVTVDAKPAGSESVFTATVLPNVPGEVLFVVTAKAADGETVTEIVRQQAPIDDGKATFNHTFANAGEYVVQAAVLSEGKTGAQSAPYAFTVAQQTRPGGSTVSGDVTAGDLAGPIIGAVVSLAVLVGSQTHIPALEQMITATQKSLGIYNPQVVSAVENALPVAGGVIGAAGLAGAIAGLVKALKDANVEITVEKNAASDTA